MPKGALGLNFLVDVAEANGLRRLLCDGRRHDGLWGGVEDHYKGSQSL
jgi:hypothetical protein